VEQESGTDGLAAAVRRSLKRLRGLFALVLISADDRRPSSPFATVRLS
jgi:glucosamine 6-phosphate synthetase-like amidotransferase/phosphosugar isomerase protein